MAEHANLSDIIDVIKSDPHVSVSPDEPYLEIIEQPAGKANRFRYQCEGGGRAGPIPGARSTTRNKTFPTVKIVNYKGPALVIVSLVCKDEPYRQHPHKLVGRDGCRGGVCTLPVEDQDMTLSFTSLGIQCSKRNEFAKVLEERRAAGIDPFNNGFDHADGLVRVDQNAVRLCFQAFIGKEKRPLYPVVSDIIYDRKAVSDLSITELSHCNSLCTGGRRMIILCEKVSKDDIHVEFYEEDIAGKIIWSEEGKFTPNDVHKQYAISLETPPYRDENITEPVNCKIRLRQLKEPLDGKPRAFQYLPKDAGIPSIKWSLRPRLDPVESFRRILAADSGLLLENVKFASEISSSTNFASSQKETHTPPPLPAKRCKKPRALPIPVQSEASEVPRTSLQCQTSSQHILDVSPDQDVNGNGGLELSNMSMGDEGDCNGNNVDMASLSPPLPLFCDSETAERLAMYASTEGTTLSELDELEELSLYMKMMNGAAGGEGSLGTEVVTQGSQTDGERVTKGSATLVVESMVQLVSPPSPKRTRKLAQAISEGEKKSREEIAILEQHAAQSRKKSASRTPMSTIPESRPVITQSGPSVPVGVTVPLGVAAATVGVTLSSSPANRFHGFSGGHVISNDQGPILGTSNSLDPMWGASEPAVIKTESFSPQNFSACASPALSVASHNTMGASPIYVGNCPSPYGEGVFPPSSHIPDPAVLYQDLVDVGGTPMDSELLPSASGRQSQEVDRQLNSAELDRCVKEAIDNFPISGQMAEIPEMSSLSLNSPNVVGQSYTNL
ncbi:unnamed protein product [Cyprideis torosa]|uniref:Uncharacterized protein n=1 Tax=Cyprideis torosa TaxID=163714 RepID=A0A7R8W609_9CRUS|nr:unnamed protein product [Cyprideis torosa]CAG0881265.1 unnamed protein product [Cyprideis torosa]